MVRRHRLEATGAGKRRRFSRAAVEAIIARQARGRSVQTANHYLSAVKQFCRWLVKNRRTAHNPVEHLEGGNVKTDRRHDRRAFTEAELTSILATAAGSERTFRGLTGRDRRLLYEVAMVTGFRAEEVSTLTPASFRLDDTPPVVILPARDTKNGDGATQPLHPDTAAAMREYLAGRPSGEQVWPGSWFERAADMLRVDLDAAGIPYVVDSPSGPLYGDFHALRHSFVALLDKSGATLKEAMALTRHSDPKLTMARYGRSQLQALADAVNRLPALTAPTGAVAEPGALRPGTADTSLAATGGVGAGSEMVARLVAKKVATTADPGCDPVTRRETDGGGDAGPTGERNPLPGMAVEFDRDGMMRVEMTGAYGNRTHFQEFMRLLLDH